MEFLEFDEVSLVRRLGALDLRRRSVFALLCATRLIQVYHELSKKTGSGDPVELGACADRLSSELRSGVKGSAELERAAKVCEGLIPDEDECGDETQALSEDAVAALAYALRAFVDDRPEEAGWAARRAYEATVYYAENIDQSSRRDDWSIAVNYRHPVVQAELRRQQRDLDEITALDPSELADSRLDVWLERSRVEGRQMFRESGSE